ncbi:hypothetical protein OTU49_014855 [Cherax quadricarinatus]|uniref:Uncharacterized protein n=1 Tax=Cherax quadricarinatus TaxID=27406 RepID=A0AAW0YEY1_CHEQU
MLVSNLNNCRNCVYHRRQRKWSISLSRVCNRGCEAAEPDEVRLNITRHIITSKKKKKKKRVIENTENPTKHIIQLTINITKSCSLTGIYVVCEAITLTDDFANPNNDINMY